MNNPFEVLTLQLSSIQQAITAIQQQLSNQPTPDPTSTGSKRIVTAPQAAKYLRRPISAIYQMVYHGNIQPLRMPNSRKLYFDLDVIDSLMCAETQSTKA